MASKECSQSTDQVSKSGKSSTDSQREAITRRALSALEDCTLCSAHTSCTVNNKDGVGPYDAKVLVIHDLAWLPLNGGFKPFKMQAINEALKKYAGVSTQIIRHTWALRCANNFVQLGNLQPTLETTTQSQRYKACRQNILDEIEAVNPKVVIVAGPGALYSVLGKRDKDMTKYPGSIIQKDDRFYIVIKDAAAASESDKSKSEWITHITRVKACLKGSLISEPVNYRIISTEEELLKVGKALVNAKHLAFDFETDNNIKGARSGFCDEDRVLGVGFCWAPGKAVYIPLDHHDSPFKDNPLAMEVVSDILLSESKKIGHNALYDCYVAYHFWKGLKVRNVDFDTMLAHHLIDPTKGTHSLKYLAMMYTPFGGYEDSLSEYLAAFKVEERRYGVIPNDTLGHYCCVDVDVTFRLFEKFSGELQTSGLDRIFREITMPSHDLMFDMRTRSWAVDTTQLSKISEYYQERLRETEESIASNYYVQKFCNGELNPGSPKQMQRLLYDKDTMKLKVPSFTKSKLPSTDRDALTKLLNHYKGLKTDHSKKTDLLADLLNWRIYKKQVTTYLEGLQKHIVNNRIYTEYLIHGTETARLSSRKPNMQNIPSEFDDVPKDRKIKSIFVAPPGYKLVCADYSQIELRNLGNTTMDQGIISAFTSGVDLHAQTASNIFGKNIEDVTSGERKMGKTANFGIVYGAGQFRLANEIDEKAGLTNDEVDSVLKSLNIPNTNDRFENLVGLAGKIGQLIYEAWPDVKKWQDSTIQETFRTGIVHTPFGRVRYLPLPKNASRGQKGHVANQAINTPIQSVSSDCLLLAMVELNKRLCNKKSYIIGQVHDSIILYVHDSEIDETLKLIKQCMEEKPVEFLPEFFKIPMTVDIEIGSNWADMSEV